MIQWERTDEKRHKTNLMAWIKHKFPDLYVVGTPVTALIRESMTLRELVKTPPKIVGSVTVQSPAVNSSRPDRLVAGMTLDSIIELSKISGPLPMEHDCSTTVTSEDMFPPSAPTAEKHGSFITGDLLPSADSSIPDERHPSADCSIPDKRLPSADCSIPADERTVIIDPRTGISYPAKEIQKIYDMMDHCHNNCPPTASIVKSVEKKNNLLPSNTAAKHNMTTTTKTSPNGLPAADTHIPTDPETASLDTVSPSLTSSSSSSSTSSSSSIPKDSHTSSTPHTSTSSDNNNKDQQIDEIRNFITNALCSINKGDILKTNQWLWMASGLCFGVVPVPSFSFSEEKAIKVEK